MSVIINPGSGPVAGATVENARDNMRQFVKDVAEYEGLPEDSVIPGGGGVDQGDGRWTFKVYVERNGETKEHEVEMPGLPLRQVNFGAEENDNIWDFPRLYVDGSSWVWRYAVHMFGEEDEV